MDNEFQWRSQLRRLDEPVTPAGDLWPGIHARLRAPRRRRWPAGLAIAASLLLAAAAYLILPHTVRVPRNPVAAAPVTSVRDAPPGPRAALDWAVPANPTLAAAAHDLDHASVQLQSALEQHPDAVFLVSLINRTNAQRMRLLREPAAG